MNRGRPRRDDMDKKDRYKSLMIKVELKEKLDAKVKELNLKSLSELLKMIVDSDK